VKNKIILALIIICIDARAQLWYNKGQIFHCDPGVEMRVEGSFMNDSSAMSDHNGKIVIDSSLYNQSASIQKGSGEYDVYGDWVNSAHFIRDTSFVHLKGGIEYIKGDSASSFYNLAIEGSGRKIMQVNASVYNNLSLNSLELAINQDTLFIENPNPAAIFSSIAFASEGFVSTLDTGALLRKTNSISSYYYPFGSILGTARFRPITISPSTASQNYFVCSFQNKKADLDKYYTANKDSDVCKVNTAFYHTINRTGGNSGADITTGYLKASDGNWSEIGNWNVTGNKWNNIKNGIFSNINSYQAVKRTGWNNFSSKPYALINFIPVVDSLEGPSLLCKQAAGNFSALTDNLGSYVYLWSSSGGSFQGDSTKAKVNVEFTGSGTKKIFLTITDTATGCASNNFSKAITVSPGPKAGFSLSYANLFENSPITIIDSSKGAILWAWDFGNGKTSTAENPKTAYDNAGNYIISQIVTDANGCKDSTDKTLDIKCALKVPNVFTPNGDGVNDVFLIEGICITEYTLEIFDRWGLLVYKGAMGSSAWDGHTPSGQICPEGTYYYLLQTTVAERSENTTGFITLLK